MGWSNHVLALRVYVLHTTEVLARHGIKNQNIVIVRINKRTPKDIILEDTTKYK